MRAFAKGAVNYFDQSPARRLSNSSTPLPLLGVR